MTRTVTFRVPGPLRGKERPRTVRGKNGRSITFTPERTRQAESAIRMAVAQARPRDWPRDGAYSVRLLVSEKAEEIIATIELLSVSRPLGRIDVDQYAKLWLDALQASRMSIGGKRVTAGDGLFLDDRQVVIIHIERMA